MKNSKNSTIFGMGTIPPPPQDVPKKADLTLPPPPPKDWQGESADKKDLPLPPPPPPEQKEAEVKNGTSNILPTPTSSPLNNNRISTLKQVGETMQSGSFNPILDPRKTPTVNRPTPISEKTTREVTPWAQNNQPSVSKYYKQQAVYLENDIPNVKKTLLQKLHDGTQNIENIYNTYIKEILLQCSTTREAKGFLTKCTESVNQYIENNFINIQNNLLSLTAKLSQIPYNENTRQVIDDNFGNSFYITLQSLWNNKILTQKTRQFILKNILNLIKIVEEKHKETNKELVDDINYIIIDTFAISIVAAITRNAQSKNLQSTHEHTIAAFGKEKVSIIEALTRLHKNKDHTNQISENLDVIEKTPMDPSYKKVARHLQDMIKKAKSLRLFVANIGNMHPAQFPDEYSTLFYKSGILNEEKVKQPHFLAKILKLGQFGELEKIETELVKKIVIPQLIALCEISFSENLLIPKNISEAIKATENYETWAAWKEKNT